jgi:hypothetical protein
MTKIRFDSGSTVTIRDGLFQRPSPTLTAFLDTLAATLLGYGSLPFEMDAAYNFTRGIIGKIGVRKNVAWRSNHKPLDDIGCDRQHGAELQNATG